MDNAPAIDASIDRISARPKERERGRNREGENQTGSFAVPGSGRESDLGDAAKSARCECDDSNRKRYGQQYQRNR